MTAVTTRKLVRMVDELGAINAQISKLQKNADALKKTLKESGADEIIGTLFRAVITTKTTARLDTKFVRELLSPAQQDYCTTESTSTNISLYDL